jgi:hypothetical protein
MEAPFVQIRLTSWSEFFSYSWRSINPATQLQLVGLMLATSCLISSWCFSHAPAFANESTITGRFGALMMSDTPFDVFVINLASAGDSVGRHAMPASLSFKD